MNCEIGLDLTWSKHCVISDILKTPEIHGYNTLDAKLTAGATFQINNAKLYVQIVTLSVNGLTEV